jgi:hypothetical protein
MMVTWYVDSEGLRDPTNIPFFPERSNLVLFCFGMCTNTGQPNILRWLSSAFFPVNISSGVLNLLNFHYVRLKHEVYFNFSIYLNHRQMQIHN